MTSTSASLSPIRTIPPETLIHIFSYCCGQNSIAPLQSPALLTLGRVCGQWRDLIISNKTLWSSFAIRHGCTGGALKLLNEVYLPRSAQLPLTLEAECTLQMEQAIVECLIRHSHRWRDISLALRKSDVQRRFFSALQENLPHLQTLSLHFGSDDGIRIDKTIIKSVPELRSLGLGSPIRGLVLPWSQLVHLNLEEHHVHEVLRLLSNCTSLKRAELTNCHNRAQGHGQSQDETAPVVTHNTLRSLSIHGVFWNMHAESALSALLNASTFPVLNSVAFTVSSCAVDDGGRWPQDVFTSFLSRSSCNITSLSLIRLPVPDADLIALLALLPPLTHLSYEEATQADGGVGSSFDLKDTVLHSLYSHPACASDFVQAPLAPKLQSIRLRTYGFALSDQCFVDMVKSRWSLNTETISGGMGVACLRSVVLHVDGRLFDMEEYGPLRHLERAGMQISVFDSGGRLE